MDCLTLSMETMWPSSNSVTIYQLTCCNIPENWIFAVTVFCCKNHKKHKYIAVQCNGEYDLLQTAPISEIIKIGETLTILVYIKDNETSTTFVSVTAGPMMGRTTSHWTLTSYSLLTLRDVPSKNTYKFFLSIKIIFSVLKFNFMSNN